MTDPKTRDGDCNDLTLPVEARIDRYVRNYDAQTLATMLVEIEDSYAPYAARELRAFLQGKPSGRPVERPGPKTMYAVVGAMAPVQTFWLLGTRAETAACLKRAKARSAFAFCVEIVVLEDGSVSSRSFYPQAEEDT